MLMSWMLAAMSNKQSSQSPLNWYAEASLCDGQGTLGVASGMLPPGAYNRFAQGVFGFLNDWMLKLLTDEAVPAFNMYGLFRLADDLASIQALADSAQPVGLGVCF